MVNLRRKKKKFIEKELGSSQSWPREEQQRQAYTPDKDIWDVAAALDTHYLITEFLTALQLLQMTSDKLSTSASFSQDLTSWQEQVIDCSSVMDPCSVRRQWEYESFLFRLLTPIYLELQLR